MPKSSTEERYGRYVQGGESDVYSNRIGWWERETIPTAEDDQQITISSRYALRPDLLAYDLYGRASLAWVVLQFNNILDINTEFVRGKTISVPSYERVFFDIVTKPNNSNFL